MRTKLHAKGKLMPQDALMLRPVAWVIIMIAACAMVSGTLNVHAAPPSRREYQLKAAFLYNFAKLVEWPAEAFADTDAPFIIGVLGRDPFGVALASLAGKTVRGRKVVIKRFERAQDLASSHVLFISASERARLTQIVQSLKGSSVLTVGEISRFAQRGGIIHFIRRRNKIRFAINVAAAERAGLKISLRLLKQAKVV